MSTQPDGTAIDVIARWSIRSAVEQWAEAGWNNVPEGKESDYDRIVDRMEEWLPPDVTLDALNAAHKVLADRAKKDYR